jgi:porin
MFKRSLPLTVVFTASFILPLSQVQAGPSDKEITPVVEQKMPSFWDQQYMLGDWGGERTRLEKKGVSFDINDIGDFQADVAGSQTHHATYFGRFRASTDIDFNKLANFDGEFFSSWIWQYGPNLSGQYLHTNTLTSSIAGEDSLRIDQLWYQQGFADNMFKVKLGQVAAVNEFGATDFFDILFNDELGYAPNALFPTKQPFSPAGKPGIILWGDLSDLTPGLYAKAGAFTAYNNPYYPDAHGFNYGDDFNHGAVGSFEIGYMEQKTVYNGTYKLGINANDLAVYSNPATGQLYSGDFTAYALAEKTVYHPVGTDGKLQVKKGLDLMLEFVDAPGDRNSLQDEITFGSRYTGLIPGRDEDKVGFGVIYSKNSYASSDAYQTLNGRGLGGETTVEVDYQYNPSPWLSIQPDTQFIMDPGGDSTRSLIIVLGLRTIVRF